YPLARALQRSRRDGTLSEHFAVLREAHCRGFERGPRQTARQWVQNQGAQEGLAANDQLMELIALKNRMRPGPLDADHQQCVVMAFYDLDRLKQEAAEGRLIGLTSESLPPLPAPEDDFGWLAWGLAWVRRALFGGGR
ncbi:MAG: YkgJ family cysteine cluster protein, partial [Desulfatitalea sp.]